MHAQAGGLLDCIYLYRRVVAKMEAAKEVSVEAQAELLDVEGRLNRHQAGRPMEISTAGLCRAEGQWNPVYVTGVSSQGLVISRLAGVGERDRVEVKIPDAGSVYEFPADVTWLKGMWMGVAFVDVPKRHQPDWMKAAPQHVQKQRRSNTRVDVSLSLRLGRDFSSQYAENISNGGLFVRGVHNHEVGESVALNLAFPGHGSFPLVAEVVHVAPEGSALPPGTGFAIQSSPPEFAAAVSRYLKRLHLRRHFTVLADLGKWKSRLEATGYKVLAIPPPAELDPLIMRQGGSVAAVMVPRASLQQYKEVADLLGYGEIVLAADLVMELDSLVERIDAIVHPL